MRQDFKVWVPLLSGSNREYVITDKGDKQWYYDKLKTCCVGFSPKQKYGGWAISATDGMSVGVPYMFSDDDYYHELADDGGVYYQNDGLVDLVDEFLDDDDMRNTWSQKALNRFEQGKWEKAINQFNNMLNETIDNLPTIGETDSYKRILDFIHKENNP